MGIETAILGAAALGAGASVYSGNKASSAAKKASCCSAKRTGCCYCRTTPSV